MLIQIALLLVSHVFLPAYMMVSLWGGREPSRFGWLLKALYTGTFLLFLVVAGRWDWPSYYLRYLFAALFVVAAVASYRAARAQPFYDAAAGAWWRQHGAALVSLAVFAGLLGWAVRG